MERPTYVNRKSSGNDNSVTIPVFGSVSGVEMLVKDGKALMEKFISGSKQEKTK